MGRTLKKERHFLNSLGEEIEIKTYKPIGKDKEFVGILKEYRDGDIVVEIDGEEKTFTKDMLANVRLTIDF